MVTSLPDPRIVLDPGHPRVDPVSFEDVKEYVAQAARAMARGPAPVP